MQPTDQIPHKIFFGKHWIQAYKIPVLKSVNKKMSRSFRIELKNTLVYFGFLSMVSKVSVSRIENRFPKNRYRYRESKNFGIDPSLNII